MRDSKKPGGRSEVNKEGWGNKRKKRTRKKGDKNERTKNKKKGALSLSTWNHNIISSKLSRMTGHQI